MDTGAADPEAILRSPRDGSYLHEDTVYYGVDVREGKSWSVRAEPRYAYRSFEDLIDKTRELATGFGVGTRAAARQMAENVRKALR